MGKGNRNSRQRLENQLVQEEKLLAKEKAKQSKKKSDRIIAAACIVIAIIVVAILVLNVLGETGVFLRVQDAMYIKGNDDMKVNAAMMTFFINDNMTSWYNKYYVYVAYGLLSVDLSGDLKTQKMTSQDASYMGNSSYTGKTWFDFFMQSTIENVEMYLTYANAYDKNKEAVDKFILENKSDEEEQSIDDIIKELKASLRANNMTIADQYGKGVTEHDIRACYELIYKAQKFGEYNMDLLEKKLEENDDPVKKYPDEHKSEFISADYLSYTITVSEKKEGTQLKYDEAVKNAKLAVEKFKEAKTPADFANLIELYKKSPSKFVETIGTGTDDVTEKEETTKTATEKATETNTEKETTEEELIEKYTGTIYYDTEEDFEKWVFEETAETYDIYVDEEEGTELATTAKKPTADKEETTTGKPSLVETETTKDGKIVYEKYTVTVYMLLTKPSMDYELTHNFAYLISDQKDAVEKFLAEYIKSEKKDGDTFVDLAKKFTPEHDHSEEEHKEPVYSYNRVEQAKEDYFNDSYGLINDWIDAEERKAGDYTDKIIEITVKSDDKKTETKYYAVVLFEDHDKEAWYVDAFSGALQDSIDSWYEDAKKNNPVVPNNDVIDGLQTILG